MSGIATTNAIINMLEMMTQGAVEKMLHDRLEAANESYKLLHIRDYVLLATVSLGGVTDATLTSVSENVIKFKQVVTELGYGDAFTSIESLDAAVRLAKQALAASSLERVRLLFGGMPEFINAASEILTTESRAYMGITRALDMFGVGRPAVGRRSGNLIPKEIEPYSEGNNGRSIYAEQQRKHVFTISDEDINYLISKVGPKAVGEFLSDMRNPPQFIAFLDILRDADEAVRIHTAGFGFTACSMAQGKTLECMYNYCGSVMEQLEYPTPQFEWWPKAEPFPRFCRRIVHAAVDAFVAKHEAVLATLKWKRDASNLAKSDPVDAPQDVVNKLADAISDNVRAAHSNIYAFGVRSWFADAPHTLPFTPQRIHRYGTDAFDTILAMSPSYLASLDEKFDVEDQTLLMNPYGRFTVENDGHKIVIKSSGTPSAEQIIKHVYTKRDFAVSMLPYILNMNSNLESEKPRYQVTLNGMLPSKQRMLLGQPTLVVVLDTHTGNIFTDYSPIEEAGARSMYNGDGLVLNVLYNLLWKTLGL